MKLAILAFGAHPDDVELGCGGTLAKAVAAGKKVGIIDLTRGELGTRGTADIRDEESAMAAKILGIHCRENLNMRDGFFENNEENQLKIIAVIRRFQPEIVICNAIEDRHIDHAKGSKLVADACFLSGLTKIETHFENQKQAAWRPKTVYHYIQWNNIKPDFVVDISGYNEQRIEAIKAYKSQFYDPNSKEPETPIATKTFLESLNFRVQDFGRLVGVAHAEGFTADRILAVDALEHLK